MKVQVCKLSFIGSIWGSIEVVRCNHVITKKPKVMPMRMEVAEVAGERLGDDGEGEHGDPGEEGGTRNVPYLLRL